MSAEAALYGRLTNVSAVTALVGGRIYPIEAPQNPTLPMIVYHRIDTNYLENLNAATNNEMARMQLDCYETTKSAAVTLAAAVKTGLRRASGTFGGVTVEDIWIENMQSDIEPTLNNVRYIIDCIIWYREATS